MGNGIEIRKAKKEDIKEISHLIQNTVKKINSIDITQEQTKAWIKHHSYKLVKLFIKKYNFFCLVEKRKIIGVAWISKHYLRGLYISTDKIKKGYGKIMMDFIENYAKNKKFKKITLSSSKTAYNFYIKRGYIFKRMAYSKILGVNFQEYYMEKKLRNTP